MLPCLVTTSITLAGLLFTLFFFRETHVVSSTATNGVPPSLSPRKASSLYDDEDEDARTLVGDIESPKFASDPRWKDPTNSRQSQQQQPVFAREWTAWEIMSVRAVARVLISLFLLSFVGGAWGAVSLLFFYTPTATGGLGLSPSIIGTAMALQGLWSIVCQLGFLNRIRRRFGMALSYQLLNTSYVSATLAVLNSHFAQFALCRFSSSYPFPFFAPWSSSPKGNTLARQVVPLKNTAPSGHGSRSWPGWH